MYTGIRVSELVAIGIAGVDVDACRIRVTQERGAKDWVVPFPESFKETLALYIEALRAKGAVYSSSRAGRRHTPTGAFERSLPATRRLPASPPQ